MRQYSKAEKLKIITAYNSGVQATKLSKKYKVSRKIIYIWLNKWKQQGEKILASRKEKRFEHQNLILESQVDIVSKDLKKKPKESVANYEKRVQKELDLLRATIKIMEKSHLYQNQNQNLKLEEKQRIKIKPAYCKPYLYQCYQLIKTYFEKGFKKSFLFKLLNVSDEGYRKWNIRGYPGWKPKYDSSYDQAIELIFYDDDKDYGNPKEYGHKSMSGILGIGRKKALNAMNRLCLNPNRKKKSYWTRGKLKPEHKLVAQNLVKISEEKISFTTSKPLEKIALDISEFKVNNEKKYLWAFVDFNSRKLLHHFWSDNQEKSNLMTALNELIANYDLTNSILHTDRGSQFRSYDYWKFAEKNKIVLSMTDGYASYQNARVETVFNTLKKTYFKKHKFEDTNSFILHMNHSIWKYNNTRFHTKIKSTPQKAFETPKIRV